MRFWQIAFRSLGIFVIVAGPGIGIVGATREFFRGYAGWYGILVAVVILAIFGVGSAMAARILFAASDWFRQKSSPAGSLSGEPPDPPRS